ncbi:GAF domain-containing protein [Sagittula salina]|uniref:histidine kinase n=1 Tax=Sagittula salina TaxID=2820268 RepID=A0A940MQZ0_9RHOB|nr:GAF domain-containing protein [Sagittula salina]MBP0483181.1 GAF domain-containing protein [Sagittula salina]
MNRVHIESVKPDPADTDVRAEGHAEKLADPARLNALEMLGVMEDTTDPAHERSVRLAGRILQAPVSLVSYVDTERQFFKAQTGLCGPASEARGTPLTHSFCQYVASTGEPLMVNDAREDPLLADNGAVHDLNVVAYLGVPVRAPTGEVLGSFCVIDDSPRTWTQQDLDALNDLVAMLEAELALRHTVNEREIVLQEMNHRIRNLFSLINGMVRIDRRSASSAEALADSIARRLEALSAAHQMIVPVVDAQRHLGIHAELRDLLEKLLLPYKSGGRLTLSGDKVNIGPKSVVYMTLAIHEIATNSAKYGALSVSDGRLDIRWWTKDGDLMLDWVETGHSWGETEVRGTGFGSRLLTISLEGQLEGALTTEAAEDSYRHRMRLPLARLVL